MSLTLLTPVDRYDVLMAVWASLRFGGSPEPRAGIGGVLEMSGEEAFMAARTDLLRVIVATNSRTRYTVASGKITSGPFASDPRLLSAQFSADSLAPARDRLVGPRYKYRDVIAGDAAGIRLPD